MPRRSSSSSRMTLPPCRPLKTAALSLSTDAGNLNLFEAERKILATSRALTLGKQLRRGRLENGRRESSRSPLGGVGELPGGGVNLPGFVGQLGREADERGAGSLVRMRGDPQRAAVRWTIKRGRPAYSRLCLATTNKRGFKESPSCWPTQIRQFDAVEVIGLPSAPVDLCESNAGRGCFGHLGGIDEHSDWIR